MHFQIKEHIYWVGKIDWELRNFHGEEYTTHRGSSYNSYLIRDRKTALIDTVWSPFTEEFIENLRGVMPLEQIDYVVANHAEPDHSGGLAALMHAIPDTPVVCTANATHSLQGHYHRNWNFKTVKTGDRLNLGSRELVFIEAPMLHWPDSMFCYLTGDNILFSNDAFGQHYASELMYNDLVDQAELYQEAIKYYANILTPFSMMVERKINEVLALHLPVDMICPSHGIIWRDNPLQIVNRYAAWAQDYRENQIAIVYDSMWGGTRRMAEAIAAGIAGEDREVTLKLYNIARADRNDIVTEVFKSKALLVGSPTINRGMLSDVAGLLEMLRGLQFKKKKAAAFGCYGWSGESVKNISDRLAEAGFDVVHKGLRETWEPDEHALKRCRHFGRFIAEKVREAGAGQTAPAEEKKQ